jgi:glycosyltransferase involved in cell wall biosynthesis
MLLPWYRYGMQSREKVIYLITKSNWGGAQRYVYDLATSLPDDRFAVTVALGGSGILRQKLEAANVRTIEIPRLGREVDLFDDARVLVDLVKLFRREQPDAIHVNSSKIGGLGALAGRITGVGNIVFTAHGWPFNEDVAWWKQALMYFFSWLTALFSHSTVTICKKDFNQGLRMPLVSKKIALIPNGIPEPSWLAKETARASLEKRSGPLPPGLWIGTIAELHPNKGLAYAIEALAKLRRMRRGQHIFFFVLGEGVLRPALESLVDYHGLRDSVFLVGHVQDAATYLGAFDIFLLPSLKEGLPYTMLEAGLREMPVIATAVGGIPDIIADGMSGLVIEPKNADAIFEAVSFYMDHPAEALGFGRELKKTISEHFSLQSMVPRIVNLYTKTTSSQFTQREVDYR